MIGSTNKRRLRVVIAPDKFKGSLTAAAAAEAMAAGVRDVHPEAEVVQRPIADGGEGTVAALLGAGATSARAPVTDPLGRPTEALYAVLDGAAYLETAQACGLAHVASPDPLTARSATTYGVGELIRSALDAGHRRIVLGLGGSASTDGGAGMAMALGARLLDRAGAPLPVGGAALAELDRIDVADLDRRVAGTEFVVASDVTSPLLGPTGSAALYGPQKGAAPADVLHLEAALARYAEVVLRDLGVEVAASSGGGAAGGLAAGAMAFLGAQVVSGIDLVVDLLGLADEVDAADLVLVGEGRLDSQSVEGKGPIGVARLARDRGVPVLALAGQVSVSRSQLIGEGVAAAYALLDTVGDVREAQRNAGPLLRSMTSQAIRDWQR